MIRGRTIEIAEVDHWSGQLQCPICERYLDVHTPRMPLDEVDGLGTADGGKLPVFGASCDRHRESVYLPAPPEVAPDTFDAVNVRINGDEQTVALPKPVLSGGDSR